MTCREVVEFLLDYLDGELPESVRGRFEGHLVSCPPCGTYLETYARTIRLAKGAFPAGTDGGPCEPPPPELVAAVAGALREAGREYRREDPEDERRDGDGG